MPTQQPPFQRREFGEPAPLVPRPMSASRSFISQVMLPNDANPIGTFWSAVMMLDHLGEAAAGKRLMAAIERVTADKRFHTPDLGGTARTADVTAAVIDAIKGANV